MLKRLELESPGGVKSILLATAPSPDREKTWAHFARDDVTISVDPKSFTDLRCGVAGGRKASPVTRDGGPRIDRRRPGAGIRHVHISDYRRMASIFRHASHLRSCGTAACMKIVGDRMLGIAERCSILQSVIEHRSL
jgi:hypothetical protein